VRKSPRVGDTVVIKNLTGDSAKYNGEVATVIGGLKLRSIVDAKTGEKKAERMRFEIELADGRRMASVARHLERKSVFTRECDKVISWEQCAWRPTIK
jgi:hypothetical protein